MALSFLDLQQEVKQELFNILNYWMKYAVDKEKGGFYGVVNGDNIPDPNAPKSVVINSRIAWTFSAAHQLFPNPEYEAMAKRAADYILKYFIDREYGGVYWSVNADGTPLQTKKQMYGHAFAIYGLTEYYKITNDESIIEAAIDIFEDIIQHCFPPQKNPGYFEAVERNWARTEDYILSRYPYIKTMNTHLHLLEAFTNLYRVWKDSLAYGNLKHSINIMLKNIIDPKTHRMRLFFDYDWKPSSKVISYGHDIEMSWLLYEAAEVLGNKELIDQCREVSIQVATAAADGIATDGALNYELNPETGHLNDSKQWWPQAEALVGFFNAYELTGKVHFLEKAEKTWEFIKKQLIDHTNGEWYGSVSADYKTISRDKVTFWKCPYHNSRACMEIWRRLNKSE